MTQDKEIQHYAGFWLRFAAELLDVLVVILVLAVLLLFYIVVGSFAVHSGMDWERLIKSVERYGNVLHCLVGWLYWTGLEASQWQATLGKKLLKLSVVDGSGRRISWKQANGRYWAKIISMLPLSLGYVMIAFTNKKQGLHDKLAGTFVVMQI